MKMKILYISQSVIPSKSANSIHVMKMCAALSKLGNQVDLFCWNNHRFIEKDIENNFKFYSVAQNFKILRLKVSDVWILREIMTVLYIIYKIFTKKYDLVYSRSTQISWFLSIFGIKTILEIHSPPSTKTNFLFKRILKKGKLKFLILINHALKKHILENYKVHKYLEMIIMPDAADDKKINNIKNKLNQNFEIKKNSIGYLGHLYQGRGVELIIKLAKEFPKNNFYIVGGTMQHIQVWKKSLNLNLKNIFFMGFQNQKNCDFLRHKFDYLIAPYRNKVYVHGAVSETSGNKSKLETSRWMSPLKLFEYMEAKKPIITTNLPSIKEIFTNEEDAILCDPNNFEQWKNAIFRLNKDANLRRKISTNAYKKFIKNFTWNLRAKNLLSNYYRLKNKKNITIFNFSLVGGGTEYMLSVLFNKLVEKKKHNLNMLVCVNRGHYISRIEDKSKLFSLEKSRVIFSIFSLINFLKKNNSNILFTSMTHTNVVAILIKIFFLPKLKVIIRESNTISAKSHENKSTKNIFLNFLVKILYQKADSIIAPTKVIKNDLVKNYNIKRNNISVIVNPYNFKEIYSKSNEIIYDNEKKLFKDPFILSVGRLNSQKNYKLLIKIFYNIIKNKKFQNYKLFILGDGREKKNLNELIINKGLKNKAYLLGFKKNPFKFMKKCKLFILSSKYEGHSNVLVHSQILNNKILASNALGANKEVLQNYGNIFINENPISVANQAIKLLQKRKKNNSEKYLLKRFNDQNIAEKFSKLF
jgi:glycosyltransferase involved in cell wall biosynthesis